MKKFALVMMVVVALITGFLSYDWYRKTHVSEEERVTFVYSWADEKGQVNFTDRAPPAGAKIISKIETLKPLEEPIIRQITEGVPRFFQRTTTGFASMSPPSVEGLKDTFSGSKEQEGPARSISSPKRQNKPLSRSRKS